MGGGHATDTIFMGEVEEGGKWKVRPADVGITLRHLLLHTSGFAYDFTSEETHSLVSLLSYFKKKLVCVFQSFFGTVRTPGEASRDRNGPSLRLRHPSRVRSWIEVGIRLWYVLSSIG